MLTSWHQIYRERKDWARARLYVAWLKTCKAIEDPDLTAEQLDEYDAELCEALAIAQEWGVDREATGEKAEATR